MCLEIKEVALKQLNRKGSQLSPRSPDFKRKMTGDSSWLDGYAITSWVEEELRIRGLKGTRNQGLWEPVHDGSPFAIVRLLKACTAMKDLQKGLEVHAYIEEHKCLGKNTFIGNTLVSMYAKCGALAKAHQVLKELPNRDVVSWTVLIAGYAQQGQGEEALKCFNDMLCEGHFPDAMTFASILKACGSIGAVARGEEIYKKIVNMGMLEKDIVLGNTLVDMYVKCGALGKAQQVLRELPFRDVVSWNTLITGYAQQGQGNEALKCFNDMLHEGHSPDEISFIYILKACGSIGAVDEGREIHNKIISLGLLEKHSMLGTSLVDMYVKCGALVKAQHVLEELPVRDVVSWSALIAGYAHKGQGQEALKCYDNMLREGHSPDVVTFACVLNACGSIGAAAKVDEIHERIVTMGMLEKDIVLGTTLIDKYMKCGALAKAQLLLEDLPIRDVISWTALIAGYAQKGQGEEALKCFDDMLREGHSPTIVTFICVLKACGSIKAAAKGEEIHDMILNMGMLEKDIALGTTLVDMYVKCGALAKAQQVLKELPIRDVVSWSALIAGYAQQGQGEEALKCFNDMLHEGHTPDAATFVCLLNACGSIGAAAKGKEIHDKIVNLGMMEKEKNIVLGTSLVDMYVKCSALSKARKVLRELPIRDVVSWSAVITGYTQQGQGEEALKCFDDMLCEGHTPDVVTFICALKACGSIGAASKGEEIHAKIANLGMLKKDLVLGASLMHLYAKCGAHARAQRVLEELALCDAVSWNALASGYAQQGQSFEVINCFERMLSNGVKPDLISLTAVLNACSHSGLLDEAETYYSGMCTMYDIHPSLENYCCMIDVFARAGKFNKVLSMIAEMPHDKCLRSWFVLLGGCRKWAEVKIGRLAFKHALILDKGNGAVYILMADIYTAAGMQEEAQEIGLMRMANKA